LFPSEIKPHQDRGNKLASLLRGWSQCPPLQECIYSLWKRIMQAADCPVRWAYAEDYALCSLQI